MLSKLFHRAKSSVGTKDNKTQGPFPSTVQFQGRWELEGEKRYATWCGSSVHFRTTSRLICLELGDLTALRQTKPSHPNILWKFGSASEIHLEHVEGLNTLVLEPESGDTDSDVIRDVSVMLCDWGAAFHIRNIYTRDNKPILSLESRLSAKRLLFIGASLVSGFSPPYRDLVLPQGTFQTFPCIVARTLQSRGVDVRLEMVAYPGLRLTTTNRDAGMEDIFWDGRKGAGGWDTRSKDSPDDIFICIGSNDRAWGENEEKFLERYEAFLTRLRDSYQGSCKRIYVISPFGSFHAVALQTGHNRIYEPGVQQMVEALGKSWSTSSPEGTKLYHISTDGWIDKSLTCDKLHPSAEGHDKIATKLVGFLDSQSVL